MFLLILLPSGVLPTERLRRRALARPPAAAHRAAVLGEYNPRPDTLPANDGHIVAAL